MEKPKYSLHLFAGGGGGVRGAYAQQGEPGQGGRDYGNGGGVMTVIPNTKTPRANNKTPAATFRLELYRDGDKIVLDTPSPRCYRDFHNFTVAEKRAYENLVAFMLDRAQEAMMYTREEIAERTARLVAKKKGGRK